MLDALLFSKTSPLLAAVYRDCLWKVKTTKKVLYLTFDDGPIPEVTPFVLQQLKKYGAKATFFCIGKNVDENPEIFEQIISDGHAIGNHTYDHLNGWSHGNKHYYQNIGHCDEILGSAFSIPQSAIRNPQLFRPPYGKLKPAQYLYLKNKYKIVMWDVLSFDFDLKISKEQVLKNVISNCEPGSIVVFHDSLKAWPKLEYALPKVLEYFSEQGYKFEKL